MKKIPTIFLRDFAGNPSLVTREPNSECGWVFAGEGIPTRKYDGTCCMFDGGFWWKRREIKPGKKAPGDFREEQTDATTGKRVGWVPIDDSDKWHLEAIELEAARVQGLPLEGTYELCGPKVQGNPEGLAQHEMICHAVADTVEDCPRDFDGLREFMLTFPYEGVVFHHLDGRMSKIKRRDFGM